MKVHGLLLEKHAGQRPGRSHDGKVVVMRSDLRWCSDMGTRHSESLRRTHCVRNLRAFAAAETNVRCSRVYPWNATHGTGSARRDIKADLRTVHDDGGAEVAHLSSVEEQTARQVSTRSYRARGKRARSRLRRPPRQRHLQDLSVLAALHGPARRGARRPRSRRLSPAPRHGCRDGVWATEPRYRRCDCEAD